VRFIRSLEQCRAADFRAQLASPRTCGVTIGNFDGMHLGHQELFSRLHAELSQIAQPGAPPFSGLLTFYPHPRHALSGVSPRTWDNDPRFWLVHPLSRRLELAGDFGFDFALRLKFSSAFAALSPEQFVEQYLVGALGVRVVVVGDDWRFGAAQRGDAELLHKLAKKHGFRAITVPPVIREGVRVSTSLVKRALVEGDFTRLEALLGRRFVFSGKVRSGDKRGRALGFPTANLLPHRQLLPPDGVYAARVYWRDLVIPAVTNIGCSPTFGGARRLVETHLLGGSGYRLYRERIRVEFVSFLRPEHKFAGAEALREQLVRDVEAAQRELDLRGLYKFPESS